MNILITAITFILILFVIVLVHELGHFVTAKRAGVKVTEFGIGLPPRLFSFKRGETTYSLNSIPLGAFVKTVGEKEEEKSVPGSLAGKSPGIRMLISFAGPLANGLLAFILFTVSFVIPFEVITEGAIKVVSIEPGSPAAKSNIQADDIILSINGEETNSFDKMSQAIEESSGTISMVVQRGEKVLPPITVEPEYRDDVGRKMIGVQMTYSEVYETEKRSHSLWQAMSQSGQFFTNIPAMFRTIFQNLSNALVGIVGAAQFTGEVVKIGSISLIIALAGSLSLGIGLFNLFPIPPLDGGGIMVAFLEWLRRGKKLPPRILHLAYAIGTALLIGIFVLITYNDIFRWIQGGSFFP